MQPQTKQKQNKKQFLKMTAILNILSQKLKGLLASCLVLIFLMERLR